MYNSQSTCSVALRELSGHLVELGKYSSAVLDVKNAFKYDKDRNSLEVVTTLKESKTIKSPIYKCATRNLNLGYSFIEMSLNLDNKGRRPKPPKSNFERFLRTEEGKIFKNWNIATDEQKIKVQLEKIASDIGCELISFEILE